MKTRLLKSKSREDGSLVLYFVFVLIFVSTLATVASYVTQTTRLAHRRSNMVGALEFAQGAAVVAAFELERAYTNRTSNFYENLTKNASGAYTLTVSSSKEKMYERVISTPFSNQTVTAQLWMTNAASPPACKVITMAKVGSVSQTAVLHIRMSYGLGAAIVSDNPGTTAVGVSKGTAQDGNVVVNGNKNGPTVIDGGPGLAILANGRVNIDNNYASVPPNAISMTNYNTADQIPDYTAEGATDQLFDFNRYIAVADVAGTHYSNLTAFIAANNAASAPVNGALEGVIVIDIAKSDPMFNEMKPATFPKGINVRGTLVFNFIAGFKPDDKIVNTAAININAANLTGVAAGNPKTYTTGYPPTYSNSAKQPWNVDITSKGFANFSAIDDLPALMYNVGILDIHGPANICGSLYTPSFIEIENKQDGQMQYIKGSIIAGGGVYVENEKKSSTVISYDPAALDYLATSSNKGKKVAAMFWK